MQRENRVLKDLVERLHLELEEAVRREHRWKQKVTKLKARAETPDMRPTPQGVSNSFFGKGIEETWSKIQGEYFAQATHDYYPQSDHLHRDDPHGSSVCNADAAKRALSNGAPRFHASRREPTLDDPEVQHGLLNQGGLLSISSISPQTSVPPLPGEAGGDSSVRSTDSGMLPQRPTRRHVVKPDNVPRLDFSRLKDNLEDEEEEEEEMELEGQDVQEEDLGSDYAEMQAHGKISLHDDMGLGELSQDMLDHRHLRPDHIVGHHHDFDDYHDDDFDQDDADSAVAKYMAAGGRGQNIHPGLSDRSC
jgi:hypothetical protein